MKRYTLKLSCIHVGIIAFFLSSCGTPKIVKEHLANDDVLGLINDYQTQKPKHRQIVSQHLFGIHDYGKDNYGTLQNFRKQAVLEPLVIYYDSLIDKRESNILETIDGFSNIDQVASYYKSHTDEQNFLHPVLTGVLMQNIEDYDYVDVRRMYRAFSQTDISDSIYPYYSKKRTESLPYAMKVVDEYCDTELKLVNAYMNDGHKQIPQVAANAFDGMIDDLLDMEVPNDMDRVKGTYQSITNSKNPVTDIKNLVRSECTLLAQDIKECRSDLINQLLETTDSHHYKMPVFTIKVNKKDVGFPINDFKAIAQIQNRTSGTSTLLSLASFIPGAIGWIASALDIYKSSSDAKEQGQELLPYMKQLSVNVFKNLRSTCVKQYNESFNGIKKDVKDSQKLLKQEIYENY